MPEYTYECPACKQSITVERPMRDSNVPIMDRCGVYFHRVFDLITFTDRPTSPAIARDPIAKNYNPKWWNY